MVSNQKFEFTLSEIHEITSLSCYLFTAEGMLIASVGEESADAETAFLKLKQQEFEQEQEAQFHCFLIAIEEETEYVLLLSGEPYQDAIGRMAAAQVRTLAMASAQQYDRAGFMQNVILANMLPIEVITRGKKLHVENARRVVYIIDTAKKNHELVLATVKNLSNIKNKDFVFRLDESSVILVKELPECDNETEEDRFLQETASQLVDNIHMEVMVKARVGYGNPVEKLIDVAKSYQEARMALEVGRVFYAQQDTISYGRLGIGRLIYQLPQSLCEMFIREVFGETVPDILEDEEAMNTINRFFENSLNISETARQLYLHRNTLVYRLERIEKAIGLDIRNFEDAMTFRIAVMVLAHMKENV